MFLQADDARAEKNSLEVMSLYVPPKLVSIKSDREIRRLLESGQKIYTRFGIFFLAKNEKPEKQFAVLVKKNVGIAVKRTCYKRLIREYVKNNLNSFSNYNEIIFLINRKIDVPFAKLKIEFDQKLQM